MDNKKRTELRKAGHDLKVTFQLGKNGITEEGVQELVAQLKRNKLIKVKVMEAATDSGSREELLATLLDLTGAALIESKGHTALLYRP